MCTHTLYALSCTPLFHAESLQQIDRTLLANAHYMLKPFVLRRLKSEVEQKLPPKYETKIDCPMTEVQKDLTRALLYKESGLISKLDSTGGMSRSGGSGGSGGGMGSGLLGAGAGEYSVCYIVRTIFHANVGCFDGVFLHNFIAQ